MSHHNRGSVTTLIAFVAGAAVWAFFGERIKDRISQRKEWRDLKKEVEAKYNDAADRSRETYNHIVDDVANKYAKARDISENELVDLIEDLKMHWGRIKNAWN